MATYYLDTSALVKRYIREVGSAWVITLTGRLAGHDLYTVRLTGPEMIAAIGRKVRMKAVPPAAAQQAARLFRNDWQQQYQILAAGETVIRRAMYLAGHYPLRGYDATHLAAAWMVNRLYLRQNLPPPTFLSADADQLAVAATLGLTTDNPLNHP
jgi:predicted nucleic acid-binding protein